MVFLASQQNHLCKCSGYHLGQGHNRPMREHLQATGKCMWLGIGFGDISKHCGLLVPMDARGKQALSVSRDGARLLASWL